MDVLARGQVEVRKRERSGRSGDAKCSFRVLDEKSGVLLLGSAAITRVKQGCSRLRAAVLSATGMGSKSKTELSEAVSLLLCRLL